AEYPCVGMDTQGTGILVHPARQGDETPRALRVREGARAPRGRQAASFGDDPDLEYLRDAGFQIVFAMDDTRAGAHDLDVAGLGPALVALAVPVADRAPAHVGDDLHVGMRMRREAGAGLDRVVVPDAQRAPAHPVGIVVVGEGEVMPRVGPAVVGAAEALEGSAFDHGEGSHCVNDARMGAKVTWRQMPDPGRIVAPAGRSAGRMRGAPAPDRGRAQAGGRIPGENGGRHQGEAAWAGIPSSRSSATVGSRSCASTAAFAPIRGRWRD